jgi:hypothetical protein
MGMLEEHMVTGRSTNAGSQNKWPGIWGLTDKQELDRGRGSGKIPAPGRQVRVQLRAESSEWQSGFIMTFKNV